ncbi:helix-turn-helix transcriptional regulator [Actinacidiphila oryziradicis]|uniref:Helix-turn-helix domain-containing protein n=1 Tax=Actinacidiphila oryziradicis TaxID=2571141 RepID=A0A4U0RU32_9ACTN|nr:helix-turn-helix transcriptional regulator [Actinacidiphila oryziradicis]TJZ99002.1 helix-turn-helix domain-containing protein [Actinacidiphila oryziradicis]
MKVSTRWPSPSGLGGMLWQARQRAGLSALGLGRLAGVSGTHVQNLEAGWHRPSESIAARLADALPLTDWERALLLGLAVPDADMRSRRPR